MENLYDKISETAEYLRENGVGNAEFAVILGTGMGNSFVNAVQVHQELDYAEIPNFPVATVEYHQGKLLFAEYEKKKILIFHGRFHYYEGYDMQQVTFPVRVAKTMGCRYLFLSNAAGGVNLNLKKGELMLVDDHINLQPDNPLRGLQDDRLGPLFVDLYQPYSKKLNDLLKAAGEKLGTTLTEGVYAAVSGPNLETRAEYRYLGRIGADAVGMSTVPEVIVANQVGIECAAISMITDECDPDNLQPVNIPEIMEIAKEAEVKITRLFLEVIRKVTQ